MFAEVKVVLDPAVRELCTRPYPGHPRGCPNHGKKPGCPPQAPLLGDVLDLARPVYAIWNCFPLGAHIMRMRAKHPAWSERQLACCLYWQPAARKQLKRHVRGFLDLADGCAKVRPELKRQVVGCPEAAGVNVTATMQSVGIDLEWPPWNFVYQVVLAGTPRGTPPAPPSKPFSYRLPSEDID